MMKMRMNAAGNIYKQFLFHATNRTIALIAVAAVLFFLCAGCTSPGPASLRGKRSPVAKVNGSDDRYISPGYPSPALKSSGNVNGHLTDSSPVPPRSLHLGAPSVKHSKPESLEKILCKAVKLERRGNLPVARKLLEEIIDAGDRKSLIVLKARQRLAPIYHRMGEYEPAIREYGIILKSDPKYPLSVKAALARAYLAGDRPREVPPLVEPGMDKYCRWGTRFSLLASSRYATYAVTGDKKLLKLMKSDLEEGLKSNPPPLAKNMLRASLSLVNSNFSAVAVSLEKNLSPGVSLRDRVSAAYLVGAIEVSRRKRKQGIRRFEMVARILGGPGAVDPENLLDGYFALLTLEALTGKAAGPGTYQKMASRVYPEIRDPETLGLVNLFNKYARSVKSRRDNEIIRCLEEMAGKIDDESIEGDYFFDVVYRPFNLAMIYTLQSRAMKRKHQMERAGEYEEKAREALDLKFPPRDRR